MLTSPPQTLTSTNSLRLNSGAENQPRFLLVVASASFCSFSLRKALSHAQSVGSSIRRQRDKYSVDEHQALQARSAFVCCHQLIGENTNAASTSRGDPGLACFRLHTLLIVYMLTPTLIRLF
jgi:hypothetical protein